MSWCCIINPLHFFSTVLFSWWNKNENFFYRWSWLTDEIPICNSLYKVPRPCFYGHVTVARLVIKAISISCLSTPEDKLQQGNSLVEEISRSPIDYISQVGNLALSYEAVSTIVVVLWKYPETDKSWHSRLLCITCLSHVIDWNVRWVSTQHSHFLLPVFPHPILIWVQFQIAG